MCIKDKNQGFLELYLNNKYFADEANQTIGSPLLSKIIYMNRRNVSSRLTSNGNKVLQDICNIFEKHLNTSVTAKWNIYCGCSCPCSPGFRLSAKLGVGGKLGYDSRYNLFIDSDGVRISEPKNGYRFYGISDKFKKAFIEIKNKFG